MNFNKIILSHATYVGPSGATAAATAAFFSQGYKPPTQDRAVDEDVVINQNGKFMYVYDNGPGFRKWAPFELRCEEQFKTESGLTAAQQYAKAIEMWEHPGNLGMKTPDGTYIVHWGSSMDRSFRVFPRQSGDLLEWGVVVQLEEGQ